MIGSFRDVQQYNNCRSFIRLTPAIASVVDMQVAGRWKSSQMPAHYAKAELAERGAIARFKDGKR